MGRLRPSGIRGLGRPPYRTSRYPRQLRQGSAFSPGFRRCSIEPGADRPRSRRSITFSGGFGPVRSAGLQGQADQLSIAPGMKQYPEHRVADSQRRYFSIIRRWASRGVARASMEHGPKQKAIAAEFDILAPKSRSGQRHPCCDARVGSGATRTKVLPKFSPRSISAKAVGITSSPSRISSR